MKGTHWLNWSVVVASLTGLAACVSVPSDETEPEPTVSFVEEIKPVLEERCVMCHNKPTLPKRTSFETGKLALKGDDKGPVIIPGNAAGSRLITAVSSPDIHETAMPPVSHRVSEDELALLKRWIDEGAHWPEGEVGRLVPPVIPRE